MLQRCRPGPVVAGSCLWCLFAGLSAVRNPTGSFQAIDSTKVSINVKTVFPRFFFKY